jgi:anti-anti-sigma regulatory factor
VLDLQRVCGVDGQGLGMLINLPKRAASRDREMRVVCVTPDMMRILEGSQLLDAPYRVAPTLASAFTSARLGGLRWQVQCADGSALVEVTGTSDLESVEGLEGVCAALIGDGRRVDVDLRAVNYVDLALLSALGRLSGEDRSRSRLGVIAGDTARAILKREKAMDRFNLVAEARKPPSGPKELLPEAAVAAAPEK